MPIRRSYGQGCGTAYALDLVGDRWALLVVRELVFGPKRFTDLRDGLPGIGPNVLSQRLKELEDVGVVRRRVLPPPAGSTVYELTEWGAELEEVLVQLGRWGARSPDLPSDLETQAEWVLLGLRAIYDPDGDPPPAVYELHLGDEVFWARVRDDGSFRVGRGAPTDPDLVITTDAETVAGMMRGGLTPAAALRSRAVELDGSRTDFNRFLALFKFPPSALPAVPERS
jgi:DNA-binding HxlR family transcriptional regulator